MKKGKWVLSFFISMFALFILAGCQGEKLEEDNKPKEGSESSEEGVPKLGGHLKAYNFGEPATLDPHKTSSVSTNNLIGLVYNKLITFSTGPGMFKSTEIIPELAKDWEVSEDGKIYTFYLRDDIKWQNVEPVNGRAFTADDVIATMERIIELPGIQANNLAAVEKIEAPDDYTVVFTLSEPYAPFLNHLASYYMWILPREATEGKIDLDNTAIGTGPFTLDKWVRNVETSFVKNPEFFEEGKPYLDAVTLYAKGDSNKEVNGFRTGQVDVLTTMSKMDLDNVQKTDPEANIQSEFFTGSRIFINQDRAPFDNLLIRKAISKAIDREGAWESIYGGGEYSDYLLPTLEEWVLPLEERKSLQDYDPEGAKELLAEAGFPDGFETTLIVTDGYGPELVTLAEWVVEDLNAIGIKANIEVLEYATFFSKRWPSQEYDIGIGLVTPVTDPSETLLPYFKSDGFRNWQGVADPKLDEMLVAQNKILNKTERIQAVQDIERYIYEEVSNHVNLFSYNTHYIKQPYVKGFDVHTQYGQIHMKNVWLDK